MKKLRNIVCNACKIAIASTKNLKVADWANMEDFHLCKKCEREISDPIRLDELERAREFLNSDYYWKRVKELTKLSDEQIEIMKFNENQST